jgi:uncharacterized protein (DUF302 family)
MMLMGSLAGCATPPKTPADAFYEVATTKPYADVLAELEVAITEQNFRITGHNHIGSVIRTRDNIPFPDFDAIQFCSLTLARQMLEMSPASVAYMPCNISVRSEGAKVVIATHLLPENGDNPKLNEFFRGMNEKLRRIVNFAAEQ